MSVKSFYSGSWLLYRTTTFHSIDLLSEEVDIPLKTQPRPRRIKDAAGGGSRTTLKRLKLQKEDQPFSNEI